MLSFFAFGFFGTSCFRQKAMERDDRSSLNLSVAKCRFFFVDSVHASFTSFVRLLRFWQSFLMATHHDQMTFTNQQTSTNSIPHQKNFETSFYYMEVLTFHVNLRKVMFSFCPCFFWVVFSSEAQDLVMRSIMSDHSCGVFSARVTCDE